MTEPDDTSADDTPAVVFKDPPKVRRRRKPLGSFIFNEKTRALLEENPGHWALFHTAGYPVPTKRWKQTYPGFEFYVANVTERDDEGEYVGEKRYEVYGRYVGESGEFAHIATNTGKHTATKDEASDDFSPAVDL